MEMEKGSCGRKTMVWEKEKVMKKFPQAINKE